ncbi:MAG TPA: sugar phosphate nucleotidyltransferase, partial [Sphingobium sp.]
MPAIDDLATATAIVPVILSGGSGTRLWPVSRPERPKQLLALTGEETMLQLTALRMEGIVGSGHPIIVA